MKLPKVWLLVCSSTLDDVPVGIFPTKAHAMAAITPGKRPPNPLNVSDESTPLYWKVISYRDGKWSKPTIYEFEIGTARASRKRKLADNPEAKA